VAVHAHANRWPGRAAVVEECSRVGVGAIDQLPCAAEVDRLHRQRARRRQHDELDAIPVALDVLDQPALDHQADGVQRHRQRAARRLGQCAGVAGRKHVDLAGTQLDGVRDRRVVRHAAVHQLAPLPADRRQHRRYRGACHDGVDRRAAGQPQLLAGDDVNGDHVQLERHLLEPLVLDVASDEPSHPAIGHQVVARSEEAQQSDQRVDREDLTAPQADPDLTQGIGCLDRLRA
jgi:hypothetical protein